jgi:hypothetical protein
VKARVYGWAMSSGNKEFMHCNGCIQEFSKHNKSQDGWIVFFADKICYSVHQKQIEPIREITITEEEFDKACNVVTALSMQISKDAFINLIKTELFKDVK